MNLLSWEKRKHGTGRKAELLKFKDDAAKSTIHDFDAAYKFVVITFSHAVIVKY